jgi:hypothetical protein
MMQNASAVPLPMLLLLIGASYCKDNHSGTILAYHEPLECFIQRFSKLVFLFSPVRLLSLMNFFASLSQ